MSKHAAKLELIQEKLRRLNGFMARYREIVREARSLAALCESIEERLEMDPEGNVSCVINLEPLRLALARLDLVQESYKAFDQTVKVTGMHRATSP